MGRLAWLTKRRLIITGIISVVALVVGFIVFSKKQNETFRADVAANKLTVGVLPQSNFQHVYYEYNGKRHIVGKDEVSSVSPAVHKNYIVWVEVVEGKGQIVLYNIFDKSKVHLTRSGNNQSPYVWEGRVVWEKWLEQGPQIYYYDGVSSREVSKVYDSTKPVLEGDVIAYAQEITTKQWRVIRFDLKNEQESIVGSGDATGAWPHFYNGKLRTQANEYFQWKIGFTGS
jgi:hypothetical protein